VTDFDPTQYSEEPAAVDAAGEAPAKPLSWYQRNKESVCAKYRQKYAENTDGFRDKTRSNGSSSYERNKAKRVKTPEQIARKKAYQKLWYEQNKGRVEKLRKERYPLVKDKNTSDRLKRKFGITLDEYNVMLARQDGKCAICGTTEREYDKHGNMRRLAVDHDHKTGKVRQLLCTPCNTSIGLVKESVRTLNAMINYIRKHEDTNVKTVNLTFTLDEVQALAGLLDAGVKATGLQGVKHAASILTKLEAAVAEANKTPEPQETE
jgi:hypothetical protein